MIDTMDDTLNAAMMEEFAPADPGALIEPEVWSALEEMGYSPEEIRDIYAYAQSEELSPEDAAAAGQSRERWEPTDLDGADWVLRRIREKEEAAEAIAKPYDTEIRRLEERLEWLKDEKARVTRGFEKERDYFLCRFGESLEQVARKFLACGKKKSVSLPNGTLAFRKRPASVDVLDQEEALAWAQDRGLVRTKVELDKTAVKKYLAEHPEDESNGLLYREPFDEFKVSAAKGGE